MRKHHAAGVSNNTQLKQQHFEKLLSAHMQIVRGMMKRHRWVWDRYLYIDLNGGPGFYPPPEGPYDGSPALAVKTARARELPLVAHITEEDGPTCRSLCRVMNSLGLYALRSGPAGLLWTEGTSPEDALVQCWVYPESSEDCADRLLTCAPVGRHTRQPMGLIYSDANGLVPFALLQKFAQQWERLDILMHCTATGHKRAMGLERHHGHNTLIPLDEALQQIPKKVWHIRQPYSSWQWTFLYGTNWTETFRLERQHFYDLRSPEGQATLQRLSRTGEHTDGQWDLFSA